MREAGLSLAKYEVSIDGRQLEVEIVRDDGHRALVKVDSREYEVAARNIASATAPTPIAPRASANPAPQRSAPQGAVGGDGLEVRAPMPGLVLEVCTAVGEHVNSGDVLMRLEAMKMENDIQCNASGTVQKILVAQGDEVGEGQVLVTLEG